MPAKPPTGEELGDTFLVRRQYQAAIAAYAKDPSPSATVWNQMGVAYQMMYNFKEAARCFKSSIKLDPHNAGVLNNLGTVYHVDRNYKQAERMYRRALMSRPSHQQPHITAVIFKNLGTVLVAQNKYDEGWRAYRQAAALDPGIFADTFDPSSAAPNSLQQGGAVNYFMARGCARAHHTRCAIKYLRMALDEGFTTVDKVAWSSDFASVRKEPAFRQLLAEEKQHH